MNVTVNQITFLWALKTALHAIDSRPSTPITANFLLIAENAELLVVGTDFEITIRVPCGAKIDKRGSTTLPAKTLTELIATISDQETITLVLDDETEIVTFTWREKNRKHSAEVKGIKASEFPHQVKKLDTFITINSELLRDAIDRVIYVLPHKDSRPVMTGVYCKFDPQGLTLATADGYRFAESFTPVENSPESVTFVMPERAAKIALGFAKDAREDMMTEIGLSSDFSVMFQFGQVTLLSGLISGHYPDYQKLIPAHVGTSVKLYRNDLLIAAKRAAIFAKDDDYRLRLKIVINEYGDTAPGSMVLFGRSAERGDAEIALDAETTGTSMVIVVNSTFLTEPLDKMTEERVILEFADDHSPFCLRPDSTRRMLVVAAPFAKE